MSRVYFHTPSGDAELLGSELYWLRHLAAGPAKAAWDLDSSDAFGRAGEILAMSRERPDDGYGANYLHDCWRTAVEQERRNKEIYASIKPGTPLGYSGANHEPARQVVELLKTRLNVDGLDLDVCGVRLHTRNIELNTALIAGSDPIALAAKIDGWCEKHTWVEGPDRAWLADIVEQGLTTGLYRQGMGWDARATDYGDGPGVVPLLRARDDEPVVLSHSGSEGFPNSAVGDWMPAWPEGVERRWDALSEDVQRIRNRREEEWDELPDERRWELSMAGLRTDRPWARLAPDMLRANTFHLPVTVYDLFASDRDERLRAVLGGQPGYREPATSAPTS